MATDGFNASPARYLCPFEGCRGSLTATQHIHWVLDAVTQQLVTSGSSRNIFTGDFGWTIQCTTGHQWDGFTGTTGDAERRLQAMAKTVDPRYEQVD